MTEKEMIEEMAEIMTNCIGCIEYLSCIHKCRTFNNNKIQAIRLAKQGYRKIPEGSVVLSKEDYDRLLESNKNLKYSFNTANSYIEKLAESCEKNCKKFNGITIQQARKQTAKEILHSVSNTYTNDTAWTDWLNDFFGAKFKELCEENGLKAIQTENGVKVEE